MLYIGIFSEHAEIHHVLDTNVNVLSLLINGFLLYLINCHSACEMQAYRILLGIDALLDFLLALSCSKRSGFAPINCTVFSVGFFFVLIMCSLATCRNISSNVL